MLRRALIVWGWGHITLGDRRGWLLVLLQIVAIVGLLFAAWQLIDGTRWLVVFVPLVALLVVWVGQAVHAHRRAIALGGAPGGELQLAVFLPFAFAALTAFWLVGGRHGSPASAVEAYMDAWVGNRPDVAVTLFATSGGNADGLAQMWTEQRSWLTAASQDARDTYGVTSGLDPARPFNSLRVTQTSDTRFAVELVRSERHQTTILGFIPTAGQRTVVVAQVVSIIVVEQPVEGWLPSSVWRIDHVGRLDGA